MRPTTVITCHSSLSRATQWLPYQQSFADKVFRHVDLVGYGAGPALTEQFSIDDEWQQVADAVAASAAAQPLVGLGHSYGGAVLVSYALRHPEQFTALVLYEPVAFHVLDKSSTGWAEISTLVAKLASSSALQAAEYFIDYWQQPGYFQTLPARVKMQLSTQMAKVNADFNAMMNAGIKAADYSQLTIPVHIITGEQSPLPAHAMAEQLLANLPNSYGYKINGGHMAPINDSEILMPTLQQIFSLL